MFTYNNAPDLFNFILLRGRYSEHIVKIFFLIPLFNDHFHIIACVVVDVVNALSLVLSTILIRIVVGCRYLFPALVLGLGRILCLFVVVLRQGKFVRIRRCGNGFPPD